MGMGMGMEWQGVLALAAALVPGLTGFAASRALALPARAARGAAAGGAFASLGLALACAAAAWVLGPTRTSLVSVSLGSGLRLDLGTQVDGLTVLMLVTVTLIGAVVSAYSMRYLDGDPRQARFCQWLSYTLSAVLVLVVSSNVVMFAVGWVATSHGLHRLLTHESRRPAALLAARKKFLTSRLGDVFLLAAFVLVYRTYGTLDFAEIFARAASPAAPSENAFAIGLLLVLGAMTKSAQFPFHSWLPEAMETPTPVSALMHAGIINAGGFLLIRMSPLLVAAPGAMAALALGGAFTAAFGSVVMLTQTDVKRKLAYSTVGQMGFMMLQCGLGAFGAAALHMVGHACYKGHAFLASGSVVASRGVAPVRAGAAWPVIVLAVAMGGAVVATVAMLLGVDPAEKPGWPVLFAVLAMAIAQLLLADGRLSRRKPRAVSSALGIGAALSVVYFAGVSLMERILGSSVPLGDATTGPVGAAPMALLLALCALVLAVQEVWTRRAPGRLTRAVYVHAQNGFYVGTLQSRLVQWLWPALPTPVERGETR
jgi:NAD(P)H-quinone oxidoreductase subunit 5